MGMTWTPEQQAVIDLRERNILVSAAAGSGKTAVLVERIVGMLKDLIHPVDIDQLLVVTFTRAAAGEMRERIQKAVDALLEEEPGNEHLQRQQTLIGNARITTIDSFCNDILHNYFHLIGLDPDYRVADDGEQKMMKADVMESCWRKNSRKIHPNSGNSWIPTRRAGMTGRLGIIFCGCMNFPLVIPGRRTG